MDLKIEIYVPRWNLPKTTATTYVFIPRAFFLGVVDVHGSYVKSVNNFFFFDEIKIA